MRGQNTFPCIFCCSSSNHFNRFAFLDPFEIQLKYSIMHPCQPLWTLMRSISFIFGLCKRLLQTATSNWWNSMFNSKFDTKTLPTRQKYIFPLQSFNAHLSYGATTPKAYITSMKQYRCIITILKGCLQSNLSITTFSP